MELLIYLLFGTHILDGSGGYVVSSLSLSPQYTPPLVGRFAVDPTARRGNSVLGLWHSRRR